MHPQNMKGARTFPRGTPPDALLAGDEHGNPSTRFRRPQETNAEAKRRRIASQAASNAYAEWKRLAFAALRAAHAWEKEELREQALIARGVFEQATLIAEAFQ